MGLTKKKMLFFFNYLKAETTKNSEKNYTNVSLNGRFSSIFWENFYSKFNNKNNIAVIHTKTKTVSEYYVVFHSRFRLKYSEIITY